MPRRTYHRVGLGVDTLEVNAYGSLAEHMPPLLDALQEIAIEERDEQRHRKARDAVRLETYWELRGNPLLIAPHGVGEGQFRWYLTCPAGSFALPNAT